MKQLGECVRVWWPGVKRAVTAEAPDGRGCASKTRRGAPTLAGLTFLLITLGPGAAVVPALGQVANAQEATGGSDPASLPARIRRIMDHYGMSPDGLSIYIHEVGAPHPAFTFNAQRPRNPASTMKVVTTYAGLEMLGPGYYWQTDIIADGEIADGRLDGDLVLRAGGDPYLVAERFWLMLRQLRLAGVKDISGDLVFESGPFQRPGTAPGAFDSQPYRTYNVLPNDLLLNFQSTVFRFEADAAAGRVRIQADPPLANLRLDNRLKLGAGACRGYQRGIAFDARESDDSMTAVFSGTFPASCERYAMRRAFTVPDVYNYGLFKALWQELGGDLQGGWRRIEARDAAREPLVSFRSPSLAEIIRSINKHSNNVMARHLMMALGEARYGPPASESAGRKAIMAWLEEEGLAMAGLNIDNGAGLSRSASISAHQMGAILLHAQRSLYVAELVASMPISAVDGTLRRRFSDEGLAGRLHMKTGSLDDVSALAGFATARSGRRYAIVVMVNAPHAHRGPGRELQEALVGWVMAREPGDAPAGDCAAPLVGDVASMPN
jgi:D-alanyl-D-alanine carboxypeptidase/D-alanyl-D-alanine-endopeptidase (penicillin-binding protein 4)